MSGTTAIVGAIVREDDIKRRFLALEQAVRDLAGGVPLRGFVLMPNGSVATPGGIDPGGGGPQDPVTNPDMDELVPTNLTLTTGATANSVYIDADWDAPTGYEADQITSYELETTEVVSGLPHLDYTGQTSFRVEPVRPAVQYKCRVRAVSRLGRYSPWSAYVFITAGHDTTPPAQVAGLTLTAGYKTFTAKWTENADLDVARGAGQYELEYATNSAFTGSTVVKVEGTITTIGGLVTGTTYYVRMRAIDASGNTSLTWTATQSVTPGTVPSADQDTQYQGDGAVPTVPGAPTLSGQPGFFLVEWTPVTNPTPVVYEVHISTSSGFTPSSSTKAGEVTGDFLVAMSTPTIAAFAFGTTYYAKLIAKDIDGSASATSASSGATLQQITSTQISDNAIQTPHLAANSITAGKILAGEIQAGHLAVNTITADRIATDAIITRHILAGSISTDEITAAGLNATVITFGTMSGARITANSLDVMSIMTSTLTSRTITISSGGAIVVGNTTNGIYIDTNGIRMFDGGSTVVTLSATGGTASFQGTINASTVQASTLRSTTFASGDRVEIIANEARVKIYSGGGSVLNYMQGGDYGMWFNSDIESTIVRSRVFTGASYWTGPYNFIAGIGSSGQEPKYMWDGPNGNGFIDWNLANAFTARTSTGAFALFYADTVDQSSAQSKDNIRNLTEAILPKVMDMRPIKFKRKLPPLKKPTAEQLAALPAAERAAIERRQQAAQVEAAKPQPDRVGFVAEEVESLFPEAVVGEGDMKGIRTGMLVVYAIKAIQELTQQLRGQGVIA